MVIFFLLLIIILCVILGLVILVQNPKGGGLSASIGGIGNQFMGVKQTTDVLERGTWIFAALIGLLCILSPMFIPTGAAGKNNLLDKVNLRPTTTAPVTSPSIPPPAPAPVNPK
ncbi:MAG: preprotein translocase subunit SecG [Chitinophagaceae bacterium]